MRKVLLFTALVLAVSFGRANAFDWDYSDAKFDLTADAVLGDQHAFEKWRAEPLAYIKEYFDKVITVDPKVIKYDEPFKRNGYALTAVEMIFPGIQRDGGDLHYVALIARPEKQQHEVAIIAINGHGEVGGEGHGQAPLSMFRDGAHGDYLARAGYVVIAFPNTIHESLSHLAKKTDYSIIWARLADKALDAIKPSLPGTQQFVGLGNAAGGLTSLVLAIMRPDIKGLATNGAFFSLEQTRREYRILVHPFCHDFRAFFSYSAVYALLAPKPLLVEMGAKDGLWLGAGPSLGQSWFSGTKRGAISDETIGAFLQLKQIWDRSSAVISLDIHHNGHEDVDAGAVDRFAKALDVRPQQ
jgi:hypothetical protein